MYWFDYNMPTREEGGGTSKFVSFLRGFLNFDSEIFHVILTGPK